MICNIFPLASMQSRCCPLTLMDLNPSPFLVSESSLPLPVLSSNLIAAVDGEKKLSLGSLKCFDEIFTYQLGERGCFGVRGSELHWPIQAPSLKKACGPSKMCYLCLHWRYPQEESQVLVSWDLGVSSVQRWVAVELGGAIRLSVLQTVCLGHIYWPPSCMWTPPW